MAQTCSTKPDHVVADVDTALKKQVLDVPQPQGKPNIQHNDQSNDFRRGVKVSERVGRFGARGVGHCPRLPTPASLGEFALTVPSWHLLPGQLCLF